MWTGAEGLVQEMQEKRISAIAAIEHEWGREQRWSVRKHTCNITFSWCISYRCFEKWRLNGQFFTQGHYLMCRVFRRKERKFLNFNLHTFLAVRHWFKLGLESTGHWSEVWYQNFHHTLIFVRQVQENLTILDQLCKWTSYLLVNKLHAFFKHRFVSWLKLRHENPVDKLDALVTNENVYFLKTGLPTAENVILTIQLDNLYKAQYRKEGVW